MKISVIGAGYVGLVNAIWLQEHGHNVTLIDKDLTKIESLKRGQAPFYEPNIDSALKNLKQPFMVADTIIQSQNPDVFMICVGTPENEDGSVDLSNFNEVMKNVLDAIHGDCKIIIKSTVPVGTARSLQELLRLVYYKVSVISNPEFLSQGRALEDTYNPSRIIVGIKNESDKEIIDELYASTKAPIIYMSNESAELVKYTANNFLALKLSFINEIANLCEIVGANIDDVTKGIGSDPRIGTSFLSAGIGYGGSCFPKDTKATHYLAKIHDYELKTIKATIEVNEVQKLRLIEKARKYYKTFKGLKIAILGVTFKPNTDDLREAPALDNIPILLKEGAKLTIFDPIARYKIKELFNECDVSDTIEGALQDADICLIFTEWNEIKAVDVTIFSRLMKKAIVIDGRNCYSVEEMKAANVIYESIGR